MITQPRFNNLEDWLAWQETAHPSAIDLGLDRVVEIARRLDHTLAGKLFKPDARVVTIAGTNGKGSCVATLTALLRAQNKNVGAYTSPHLWRYNERVQVNGAPVEDTALCAAFAAIDNARGDISLTYFEFGTLAALWLFANTPLDIWLLEVGLGGRLDATNIIDADIAVITSIDLDHQAWLGDDREKIGFEKAGICRAEGELVCAEPDPPQSIIDRVRELGCAAHWVGHDFFVEATLLEANIKVSTDWSLHLSAEAINLPIYSVAAALKVCERLGLLPSSIAAAATIASTHLVGRFQRILFHGTEIILDVAHNPAATSYLTTRLAQLPPRLTLGVVGMMGDKDIPGSLAPLVALCQIIYCARIPDVPRAASEDTLCMKVQGLGGVAVACDSVAGALDAALAVANSSGDARIVVTGSFFTLTAAFAYFASLGAITRG